MNKVLDWIFDFLSVVISLILIFMTLSIGYAIFARALGLPGPLWIVQFNEYAMLFATFLGSAWLLSKGRHVSIELLVSRFNLRSRRILDLFHGLMGMGLCATLCWYGTFTTLENLKRNVIHVQAVDVPMAYILFVIPLGFLLLFLQFARSFAMNLQKLREPGHVGLTTPETMDSASSESGERKPEGGGL